MKLPSQNLRAVVSDAKAATHAKTIVIQSSVLADCLKFVPEGYRHGDLEALHQLADTPGYHRVPPQTLVAVFEPALKSADTSHDDQAIADAWKPSAAEQAVETVDDVPPSDLDVDIADVE